MPTSRAWPFAITHAQLGVQNYEPLSDSIWKLGPAATNPVAADTFLLNLRHAAYPDPHRPGAAVVVPHRFDVSAPLDVVLYLHGHNGCVATAVGNTPAPCSTGGPTRNPSKLAAQLVTSGANAILVAPELNPDKRSGGCGALAKRGGFRAMLDETLAAVLPALGAEPKTSASVRTITVMAHSGGYLATAIALRSEGLEALRQVVLLDALYGEQSTFLDWVTDRSHLLGPGPEGVRFACVYTDNGGTRNNAKALASRMISLLPRDLIRHDATFSTLTPQEFVDSPVLFKRSSLDHGDVSRYYPEKFMASAGLGSLRTP